MAITFTLLTTILLNLAPAITGTGSNNCGYLNNSYDWNATQMPTLKCSHIGTSIVSKCGNLSMSNKQCKQPTVPHNGCLILINGFEGRFVCENGYYLYGNAETFCVNGQWNTTGQFCDEIPVTWTDCGNPGYPENGFRQIENAQTNRVNYVCNEGYVLIGEKERICQLTSGTWYPAIPKCVKNLAWKKMARHEPTRSQKTLSTDGHLGTCTNQRHGFYGYVDFEEKVRFDNVRLIFSEGKLNRIYVYATNKADVTKPKFNDYRSLNELYRNRIYVIHSSELSITSNKNDYFYKYLIMWLARSVKVCEIIVYYSKEKTLCGRPDHILRGKVLLSNSEQTTFKCDEGHAMVGNANICCFNGVWDSQLPSCIPTSTQRSNLKPATTEVTQKTCTQVLRLSSAKTSSSAKLTSTNVSTTANTSQDESQTQPDYKIYIGAGLTPIFIMLAVGAFVSFRRYRKHRNQLKKSLIESNIYQTFMNRLSRRKERKSKKQKSKRTDKTELVEVHGIKTTTNNDTINVDNDAYESIEK